MPIAWTYLTRDVSLTDHSVRALFRGSTFGWSQWLQNYGVWVKSASADDILQAVRLGSDLPFHEVDEATALAAVRALPEDPKLPRASNAAMAKMYEAVIRELPFEEAGVEDTNLHRVRFSGLQDDFHVLPDSDKQRLLGIAEALGRAYNSRMAPLRGACTPCSPGCRAWMATPVRHH